MKKTMYSLSAILFFVSIFIQIIFLFSMNKNYYHQMHETLEIAETMDKTEVEIEEAMNSLIDYIEKEDIELNEDFFNEREILHMIDVKNLYLSAKKFQLFALLINIVMAFWIFFKEKRENFKIIIAEASLDALKTLSFFIVFLLTFFLLDFDFFWNSFHHIFFDNDLWLLNPYTDRMIQMLPGKIFQGLIFRIGFTTFFVFFLLYLLNKKAIQSSNH